MIHCDLEWARPDRPTTETLQGLCQLVAFGVGSAVYLAVVSERQPGNGENLNIATALPSLPDIACFSMPRGALPNHIEVSKKLTPKEVQEYEQSFAQSLMFLPFRTSSHPDNNASIHRPTNSVVNKNEDLGERLPSSYTILIIPKPSPGCNQSSAVCFLSFPELLQGKA